MKHGAMVVSVFLTACSAGGGSSPSESAIADAVKEFANTRSSGNIVVESVTKTDGMLLQGPLVQGQVYVADIAMSLKFPSCGTVTSELHQDYESRFSFHPGRGNDCPPSGTVQTNSRWDVIKAGAGSAMKATGKASFERKESGWKLKNAWVIVKKLGEN